MILSDKLYGWVKWFVGIVLPAISAAVFSLQEIFDISNVEQIMGVCAILATFLGTVLLRSNHNYQNSEERFDGDLIVTKTEDGDTFRFALNTPPEVLEQKSDVTFKRVVEQG